MSILKTLLTKTPTASAAAAARQLWSWGSNASGELGDNTTVNRSSPVQIGSAASWSSVAAGNSYSASIDSTGKLYVWGNNAYNLATSADSTNRSSPLLVNSGSWFAVAAGDSHILAIANDRTLWGYGAGSMGQLGTGATVFDSTASWSQISASDDHTHAISATDGSLWSWGLGSNGQLGNSSSAANFSIPVAVSTLSWRSVAAGASNIFAVRGDGSLWSAGSGMFGQLGQGNMSTNSILTQIGSSSWTMVAAPGGFSSHAMAIRSDGRLFGWGANQGGQLGTGSTTSTSSPVQIGTSSWITVAAGVSATAAIRTDGALFVWGYNATSGAGTIPDGGVPTHRSSPVQIGTSSWVAVAIALSNGYAIRSDGRLFAWGGGFSGMNGDNSLSSSYSSPVAIGTSSWVAVSAGLSTVHAIKYVSGTSGQLFAWGSASNGFMGNNTTSGTYSSPMMIGSSSSWTILNRTMGNTSVTGAINAGKLFMWGSNSLGQLGQSDTTNRSSPVAVKTSAQLSITQISTSSWSAVAAGNSFSAALRTDGGLFTWGANNLGQLGQADNTHRSQPGQVGTSSWTTLSVEANHIAAIRTGGSLFTWGQNASGQLGLNDLAHRSSPVQVGTSSWTTVAAGASHTLGTIGTTLYGWGAPSSGAAGSVPAWSDIKIFPSHVLALKTDGSLWSWGSNNNAQLGLGNVGTLTSRSSPVQIGTSSWSAIGGLSDASYAIRSDGRLFNWGGIGVSNTLQGTFDALGSWSGVASALSHTLAIRYDGSLWGWGTQPSGELGPGNASAYSSAVQIGTSSWSIVFAGGSNTAAIRSDGALFTWGLGIQGQLGSGPSAPSSRSSPVQIGTSSWTQVAIGGGGGFAIRTDGILYGWGNSSSWANTMFGNTTTSSPVAVSGGGTWSDIWIGKSSGGIAAGIKNNLLFTWGGNTSGALGTSEASGIVRSSPVQIGTSSWLKVRVGEGSTGSSVAWMLAIKQGGTLWAWGDNSYGQLGDNTTTSKSSPVQIGSNTNWSYIDCNGLNSMAVDSTGNVYAWGDNSDFQCGTPNYHALQVDYGESGTAYFGAAVLATDTFSTVGPLYTWGTNSSGQLGLGTSASQSTAQQVGFQSWRAARCGSDHIVAANSSGSVFTWGAGFFGQLGQNNSSNTSSPVAVGALLARSGINTIAAGDRNTFVIDSNQKLWAWGNNSSGQLGDGTTSTKSSPVQIGTSSWLQVSAKGSGNYTLAIRSDGRLFAWGSNFSGQLGNGSTISASSPVAIGTSSWIFIAAGHSTSAAIRSDNTIWTWGFNGSGGNLIGSGGVSTHRSSPVQVGANGAGAGGVWSWVSVGASNMHAIKSDNSLWVWGSGGLQTGLNSVTSWSSPVAVSGGLSNPSVSYIAVASTASNAVAIMRSSGYTNNMLVIWGALPTNGALANNSTTISNPIARGVKTTATVRSSPVVVSIMSGRSSLNSISAGDGCIFATTSISPSFPMYHVGNTNNGVASVNTNKDATAFFRGYPTPVNAWDPLYVKSPIEYDSTTSWIAIGSQYGTSVVHAIRSNGSMWSWGGNMFGQAGVGSVSSISVPTQIGTSSWSAVSTGVSHALAIRSDGGLFAWGQNTGGQLGNSSTVSASSPIAIGTSSWMTLGTQGVSTSAAIRSDGGLFMWGHNTMNAAGLIPQTGVPTHRSSPIQIGTSSWTQVSVAGSNAFAVRLGGQLFAWGAGTATGGWNSTITSYSSPVAIASGLTVTKIGANALFSGSGTAALSTNSGSLYTWGEAVTGLLGDSQSATSKSSPVQVGGSEGRRSSPVQIGALAWSAVYAGNEISAGKIVSTGALYTWGSNTVGQLGQNTNVAAQYIPLQIGSSSWSSVSAGSSHVLALK